ncbi:MAG: hypothetical protein AMXMBFR84_24300 [Candidatus Hydrogenedentota bacterium]
MFRGLCCVLTFIAGGTAVALAQAVHVENAIVYKEDGRFAGWPANNGMWNWGNEIVVGFMQGYFKFFDKDEHAQDPAKPSLPRFARSLDGGKTWTLEIPTFLDDNGGEKDPVPQTAPADFAHPDFAMRIRMNNKRGASPRIYYSYDRCKTWEGPYAFPMFDQTRIMARTDYLVSGSAEILAFLTAEKPDRDEGRVFCARTTDGGVSWNWVNWVCPEPTGFSIMPASVRVSDNEVYTTIRRKEGDECWIDAYRSLDNGLTWTMDGEKIASTGVNWGNPSSLTKLRDGRLALVYGYRSEPYGIRAKLSSDNGKTWGNEIILRSDAGCWDLGYPRSVQRADGKVVSTYYYNDGLDKERYIAATIWDPGAAK